MAEDQLPRKAASITMKRKKEAKALNDPDAMSKEEQMQYQQYKRQRATKLVETMARAILDPGRDRFIIGIRPNFRFVGSSRGNRGGQDPRCECPHELCFHGIRKDSRLNPNGKQEMILTDPFCS